MRLRDGGVGEDVDDDEIGADEEGGELAEGDTDVAEGATGDMHGDGEFDVVEY